MAEFQEAELRKIQTLLERVGYTAQLCYSSDYLHPNLILNFGADDEGAIRTLHISLILPAGNNPAATKFLRFLVMLPFHVLPEKMADISHALTILNEELEIGSFGINSERVLYYKYVLAVEREAALEENMLLELIALIEFQQEHFGDYIEGICSDEISIYVLEKVIKSFEHDVYL